MDRRGWARKLFLKCWWKCPREMEGKGRRGLLKRCWGPIDWATHLVLPFTVAQPPAVLCHRQPWPPLPPRNPAPIPVTYSQGAHHTLQPRYSGFRCTH